MCQMTHKVQVQVQVQDQVPHLAPGQLLHITHVLYKILQYKSVYSELSTKY